MHGGLNVKAIVVALSVFVAACGGGGGEDKAATTGDTQPGESTTVPPGGEAQADGSVSAGSSGGAAGGTATTKPGAASASPAGGGGTSSGGGGGSTATTTPSKGGTAVATKSAKPGRYTFNRTGTRTTPIGDQSLNGPGALTVDPVNGSDQRTFLSYNQYDSTEQVVRYRPDAIDLVMLKLETQAGTFEFRPASPVLFAPEPLKVGATWAWKMTSTDNRLTLDSSFKIARTESQNIGGESVATFVVEGTINVSGFLTGTIHQTLWASDRHRLIVRTDETSDLNGLKSQASSVLASTTPA